MAVKNFFNLKVWQDAHRLTLHVYKATRDFPKEEMYGLTAQMRSAAASIQANIAEGFGRFHYKEKARFYHQARGSAVELQNHIILAKDLMYLPNEVVSDLFDKATEVIMELNGLIKSTGKRNPSF